jgi:hypothetical protein
LLGAVRRQPWLGHNLVKSKTSYSIEGIAKEEVLHCWGDRESGNTSKLFHAVDLDCKKYTIKMNVTRFDGSAYLTEEGNLKKTDGKA